MEEDYDSHSKPNLSSTAPAHHAPASTSELMASAKVVAEAAKSAISHRNAAGIDKAKVSEAAEELIDAAKRYGKLESSGHGGVGQYLDKAEDYLHSLHSSADAPQPHRRPEEEPRRHSGGGSGDYIKMAQGFLK